ncbi:cytochrome b561 and DOMON domain-containing protein At3g25290-like isoform X2 [Elaeis guineensis]|uniref:cytochrome b561 and DOMON domain-containing protein At3g25290-like isoform X2 n=1 Tax=Elaeis guineensis var. tenera TaxID=51953 RepID=UPI003C6D26C5
MSLFLALVLLLPSSLCHRTKAQWHTCDSGFSISATAMARNITHCRKLQTLGAELGINNYSTTPNSSTSIDVVFSALPPTPQGWIAWGVNPGRHPQMVGTRALIAFNQPSGMPVVNTYNVTADTRRGCKLEPSTIEVGVANKAANYSDETGRLTMAARLTLPPEYNVSKLNHVWQVGPRVVGTVPLAHAKTLHNFDSKETMDLESGVGHSQRHHDIGLREVRAWNTKCNRMGYFATDWSNSQQVLQGFSHRYKEQVVLCACRNTDLSVLVRRCCMGDWALADGALRAIQSLHGPSNCWDPDLLLGYIASDGFMAETKNVGQVSEILEHLSSLRWLFIDSSYNS